MQETKETEDWNDKKIKHAGGDWPMTSEKLINNYLKIFAHFVNSIDFTEL